MTVTEDAQEINSKLKTMSPEDSLPSWWTNKLAVASNDMNKMRDYIVNPIDESFDMLFNEESDLDEGKMSQLHQLMKDGKSAKEIAKIMKLDLKTIKALMGEALAASDDDVKAASKNIIMQLRKSVSLRGNFPVEFMDKKKVKVDAKIASAAQKKYNSMRKADDKEKFQAKIAKSYKDMLAALKEGFASDAQRRAAFAQGYKAKGKKGKKEDAILDRIGKKLKERKNG
jgi:hypothetical protein